MNKKEYLRLQAVLHLVIAVFVLTIPLWSDISEGGLGWPFVILTAIVFGFMAVHYYRKADKTSTTEMPYAPATDATREEQVKYYTRVLRVGMIAFAMLSAATAYSLYYAETEPDAFVTLLRPVAFVYENFGVLPAALCLPALGVLCYFLLRKRINQLKSEI